MLAAPGPAWLPASERSIEASRPDDAAARRWFFQSVLPEQLIRDQLDLEAAAADGFVTTAQPLDELRAGLLARASTRPSTRSRTRHEPGRGCLGHGSVAGHA